MRMCSCAGLLDPCVAFGRKPKNRALWVSSKSCCGCDNFSLKLFRVLLMLPVRLRVGSSNPPCSAGSAVSSLPWRLQVLHLCPAPPDSAAVAAAVVAGSAESLNPRLQLWSNRSSGLACSVDIACGDGWEYYGCSYIQAQWVGGCPNLVLVGGGDGVVIVDLRVGGIV
jgi:hypothetical protein